MTTLITKQTQKSRAYELFNQLPSVGFDIVFVTNRILKGIPSIEDSIIPRSTRYNDPYESFIINFQRMSKPDCSATVHIKGKENTAWYLESRGKADVAWHSHSNPVHSMTSLGQVNVQSIDELNDFTKVISWTWDFLQAYKEEMKEK